MFFFGNESVADRIFLQVARRINISINIYPSKTIHDNAYTVCWVCYSFIVFLYGASRDTLVKKPLDIQCSAKNGSKCQLKLKKSWGTVYGTSEDDVKSSLRRSAELNRTAWFIRSLIYVSIAL
jgi:hypothetical protein